MWLFADRRVITISLTEKGRALAENSPPAVHEKIIHAVKLLSGPERQEIVLALDSLSRLVEDIGAGERKNPALTPAIQQAKNTVGHLE